MERLGIVYVSFDPGQTTGVTEWDGRGECIRVGLEFRGDSALDAYLDSLEAIPVEVFIVEEYRVYGSKAIAHIGSKVHTAQVIGNLKSWARRHNVQVFEQRSDVKNVAAKWAQMKVPKGHMPDWMSSYLHGYYYLHHHKGLIRPKVLDS